MQISNIIPRVDANNKKNIDQKRVDKWARGMDKECKIDKTLLHIQCASNQICSIFAMFIEYSSEISATDRRLFWKIINFISYEDVATKFEFLIKKRNNWSMNFFPTFLSYKIAK